MRLALNDRARGTSVPEYTLTEANTLDFKKVNSFDLILLDIMMPEVDGFTLCKKLRSLVDCPIVFLTAKSGENSLVTGLSLGADDYICKPFGVMELRARISAHLRREKREHFVRLSFENASFNISAKQLIVKDSIIPLTKGEYEICEFLARNQGQVFSKEQIFEKVFGFDSDSNDNTIATHIKNGKNKREKNNFIKPVLFKVFCIHFYCCIGTRFVFTILIQFAGF